jgi:arginine repressor
MKKTEQTTQAKDIKYTKQTIVESYKYQNRKDLLNALLKDGVEYTIAEVDTIINNYLTKEV